MNKVSKILLGIGIILLSISLFLYIYYYMEDIYSSKMVNKTMNELVNNIDIKKSDNGFDIKIIDNEEYIGYIEIPSFNSLKKTPALFYGNLNKNLVICGHSYKAHFGDLYKLKQKDKVIFIDVNNNKYVYEVELIETLKSTDVKDMIESDFDLTLYTCTKDGKNRVTVRCNRV